MVGWSDLATAIGLIFVIEGLLCLAAPKMLRKTMAAMLEMSGGSIQRMGIGAAVFGVIILWLAI